jgi:putative membrane protein
VNPLRAGTPGLWLTLYLGVLVWSGIAPKDRMTWVLEVAPAVIGLVVLAATRRRYPLTPLAYLLVLVHAVILMVGGHYTYAEVPLFDRLAELFGHARNNYDKLGHFAQGFVPAVLAREILLRTGAVRGRGWLNYAVVTTCLALSAAYELIEWLVALLSDEAAEAFLGTQGYVWDTQSDMAMALLGAVLALALLGRRHDRQLATFGWPGPGATMDATRTTD